MVANNKKVFKKTYTKYAKKKIKGTRPVLKFIGFLLVSFLIIGTIAVVFLYKKYIEPLPPIESLKDMEIAESSTIYDKDGNELYKIFKENRTYVEYDSINKNMINAIVAGEDKRFWENPGFDLIGLSRAVIYRVIGKSDKLKATSTLSQQLMKVVYLSGERKVERKVKEIYLSYKLNKVFSKEKILELYLNKIEYGSNAFGIEQAAKTFFDTSAKDLGILESSILASLPKGPSYYSPYNHPDRLLGYPYIYEEGKEEELVKVINTSELDIYGTEVDDLKAFIENLKLKEYNDRVLLCGIDKTKVKKTFRIDNDGCSVLDYSDLLDFLNAIKISEGKNITEYQIGRKDFILGRMLEDGYINFDDYKKAILDSIGFTFQQYREDIKHPYFVMYVKEYLEAKYGKEVVEKGGLHIYTTLDSDYQQKAEELVEKYSEINLTKFGAQNAALVSIDNKTGQIITMVGGRDYFDSENGGNNNIITSRLQPGSTFKPFVYSLAIANNQVGTKTPVYDLKTNFPSYTPSNFDGKFMGKMTLSTALNNSRNIPAVKMFYLAGGEDVIANRMEKLGVNTLNDFKDEYFEKYNKTYGYGAPMALGTGLMTPLELASAYSVYANMGEKKYITPIVKIVDSKGNIIEKVEEDIDETKKDQVISSSEAYIVNNMLSDKTSRPEFWNSYLSLSGRSVAAKTGTSTKQYNKGGAKVIYPRNLWTVGYTPQITTVAWAGNTDGTELNYRGNGLEGAGPIWRDFMEYVHKGKPAENWYRPAGVKEVSISEISGLLPSPDGFPENFLETSLFLNTPKSYDNSLGMIKVDGLCNGKITDLTPVAAIKEGYLLNFHSLYPGTASWENPVQEWVKSGEYKEKYGNVGNVITNYKDTPCDRGEPGSIIVNSNYADGDILSIGHNYIEFAYSSDKPIIKVQILLGDNVIYEVNTLNKKQFAKRADFDIPDHFAKSQQELSIRAVDNDYYSQDKTYSVSIGSKDIIAPKIELDIPDSLTINKGDQLKITGKVIDSSSIRTVNFYLDNKPLKLGLTDRNFSYTLDSSDVSEGDHIIKVNSFDFNFNEGIKEVELKVK